MLLVEALLCLSVWGPQPLAWLWVGSQVVYHGGSNMLGIVVAFFGILASLLVTLALATRLDRFWRLLRRAAGHDQRDGVMVRDLRRHRRDRADRLQLLVPDARRSRALHRRRLMRRAF